MGRQANSLEAGRARTLISQVIGLLATGMVCLGGNGLAQAKNLDEPPRSDPPTAGQGKTETPAAKGAARPLDEVLMTVGGRIPRVILRSQVIEEFEAQKQSRQRGGETLSRFEEAKLFWRVKRAFLEQAIAAQAAWSFQGRTPEEVQRIVERLLEDRQQEEIKRYGSLNKMKQELGGFLDRSKFLLERREKEQILLRLAREDMNARLRDRLALMITPKALYEHYLKRKPQMQTGARCDLARLVFPLQDPENPAPEMARARQAADAWKTGNRSCESLAEEFEGRALPNRTLTQAQAREQLLSFVSDFIDAAKSEAVSDPTRRGPSVYVLKITRWQPAVAFRFDDPRVQSLLRDELVYEERKRAFRRSQRRDRERVPVWPPQWR